MAKLKKLLSKLDTKRTRTNSSIPRGSSSSSSSSTSTDDFRRTSKKASWLKRKASTLLNPSSIISASRSRHSVQRLSKLDNREYYDRHPLPWRDVDSYHSSDWRARYGAPSWSFSRHDELTNSELDVLPCIGRGSSDSRVDLAESSEQAQGRVRDLSPPRGLSPESPLQRHWTNVNDEYENAEEVPIAFSDPQRPTRSLDWERQNGMQLYGERDVERNGDLFLHDAEQTKALSTWQEQTQELHRTFSWGQDQHSLHNEDSELLIRDTTSITGIQGPLTSEQTPREDEWSATSSETDRWWSDDDDQAENKFEDTVNTTATAQSPLTEPPTPGRAGKSTPFEVPHATLNNEADSLYENANPTQARENDNSFRDLEDMLLRVNEEIEQMTQDLIRQCEIEHIDKSFVMPVLEDITGLEDIAEQLRSEIAKSKEQNLPRGPVFAASSSNAATGEERIDSRGLHGDVREVQSSFAPGSRDDTDRQPRHRLNEQAQKHTAFRRTRGILASSEREELDRQHALQLQQEIDSELEEANRRQEIERVRDCTVCADSKPPIDFPLRSATAQCQHPPGLCYTCLHSWMASELDTKGSSNFKCPECPETMSFEDVREAASEETFLAYDTLVVRSALSSLEEFAWCLRSGCGNGQLNIENNQYMICQACGYRQCLKHQVEWHYGETCEEYDYRVSGRKAADEARERREYEDRSRREAERQVQRDAQRKAQDEKKTAAMIGSVSKPCPARCGRLIQRNQGCDHMTCRCGHEFCWECLCSQKSVHRRGNTAHERHCKNHSSNLS